MLPLRSGCSLLFDRMFHMKDVFEVLNTQSPEELFKQYDPELVFIGNKAIIYRLSEEHSFVVKILVAPIRQAVREGESWSRPVQLFRDTVIAQEVDVKMMRQHRLEAFFGKHHTLRERRYQIVLHLTQKIVSDILQCRRLDDALKAKFKTDWDSGALTELWTVAVFQEHSVYVEQKDRLTLIGGYCEINNQHIDEVDYKLITRSLLSSDYSSEFSRNSFLNIQRNGHDEYLTHLVERAENDENLYEQVKEFAAKAVRFSSETGEILDTAGKDNIIFYRKNDGWNYLLTDALSMHNEQVISETRSAIEDLVTGTEITLRQRLFILKTINYMRTLNGLTRILKLENTLHLGVASEAVARIDFLQLLREKRVM